MVFLPTVIRAEYRGEYRIHLVFNDGVENTVDFSAWLEGPVFEPLRDQEYFRCFLAQTQQGLCWRSQKGLMRPSRSIAQNQRFQVTLDNSPTVSTSVLSGAISTTGPVWMKENSPFSCIVERDSNVQRPYMMGPWHLWKPRG